MLPLLLSTTKVVIFFQVAISVLSLLHYYKWMKFSIIFQEGAQWETIAKYLKDQVRDNP